MLGKVVIDDEPLFSVLVFEFALVLDEPNDRVDVCVIVTVLSKIKK